MGKKSTKPSKANAPAEFQSARRSGLIRKYRKSILFNEREISAIRQYCDKYGIRNRSAFFRSIIISHILEQADDNYPKLF